MTDEEYLRAVFGGDVFFAPAVKSDDEQYMQIAVWSVLVPLPAVGKGRSPWVASIVDARAGVKLQTAYVPPGAAFQWVTPPWRQFSAAPYLIQLESADGVGPLELFVPLIRKPRDGRTLLLESHDRRLRAGLV